MDFMVDTSQEALSASGIASALLMFGAHAQGTIGEAAALVLCTPLDDETNLPDNEQMAPAFHSLCKVIAEKLRELPAKRLTKQSQGASLFSFRGDAAAMVAAALQVFRPWHADFLEYWTKRPGEVWRWLESKSLLYGDDVNWMRDCKEEIDAGRLIAIQRPAAYRSREDSETELKVLKTIIVRMYLAGLKNAGEEAEAVWLQLGFQNGDREDIAKVFELCEVESLKVDAVKRYVANCMVDILGKEFVRQKYPAVIARYNRERAKTPRRP